MGSKADWSKYNREYDQVTQSCSLESCSFIKMKSKMMSIFCSAAAAFVMFTSQINAGPLPDGSEIKCDDTEYVEKIVVELRLLDKPFEASVVSKVVVKCSNSTQELNYAVPMNGAIDSIVNHDSEKHTLDANHVVSGSFENTSGFREISAVFVKDSSDSKVLSLMQSSDSERVTNEVIMPGDSSTTYQAPHDDEVIVGLQFTKVKAKFGDVVTDAIGKVTVIWDTKPQTKDFKPECTTNTDCTGPGEPICNDGVCFQTVYTPAEAP